MKKILILTIAAILIFGFTAPASADFTDPYSTGLTTAQFYAVDNLGTSGDNSVTLSNISYVVGYTLQYSLAGSGIWTSVATNSTFTVSTVDHYQLLLFRLMSAGGEYITTAYLTFTGQYAANSPLYNGVQLIFNGGSAFLFASETAAGTDHVSPAPIPTAAWLLATGLIGLVGVRRRWIKS